MDPLNLVLFGAPGSGKGTQAEFISQDHGIIHVATGDMLRAEAASNSELGRQARQWMDRGDLVPDQLILRLVQSRLDRDDCRPGFILDGFPRTLAQARALGGVLNQIGRDIRYVLHLNVSVAALVERLGQRRLCRECGRSYHVIGNPPVRPGVCDFDGGRLTQRSDDRPDVARHRIEVYVDSTAEVLDFYRGLGLVRDIDGSRSVDEVRVQINQVLNAAL